MDEALVQNSATSADSVPDLQAFVPDCLCRLLIFSKMEATLQRVRLTRENVHHGILRHLGMDGGWLGLLFISLIGLAGNWRLFVKCNQPGWAVIVPGYNVVVAMIIGRTFHTPCTS